MALTLVTGSKGFIGGRFMKRLEPEAIGKDKWDTVPPLHSVKRIAHLGAIAGIAECNKDWNDTWSWNVASTRWWLQKAHDIKAPFVFASSAAAADPVNFYGVTKAICERLCQAYRQDKNMHVSTLRFSNVYGPGSLHKESVVAKMCKDAILKDEILVHAPGDQERDLVWVDDVLAALQEAPDGLWGVRTGVLTRIDVLARHISELSGARIIYRPAAVTSVKQPRDTSPSIELPYRHWKEGVAETFEYFRRALT